MHENINYDSLKEIQTEEGKLSDKLLAEKYIRECNLYSANRRLYDLDGEIDVGFYRRDIANIVSIFQPNKINSRANDILELIITLSHTSDVKVNKNEIPVKNGTLFVNGSEFSFSEEKRPSLYRLCCDYDPNAPEPKHFLGWVNGLLHEDDIPGFQEIMGYLLLPTTQGQKAFFLIGVGEEGKSVWGWVLQHMLGNAFTPCKIPALEGDRFTMATIENKLVAYDDDLNHKKLETTDNFKSIVTNKIMMQGERKGLDKFEFMPFARLCACGNFTLSSLHDTSDGFFRRLYPIKVKNKPRDRVNISNYEEPMLDELPGILNWCLIGLKRLIENDYRFSVSKRSENLIADIKQEGNSVIEFVETEVEFGESYRVTSTALNCAYVNYCRKNDCVARAQKTVVQYLKDREDMFNIKYVKRAVGDVRGFVGMRLKAHPQLFNLDEVLGGGKNE